MKTGKRGRAIVTGGQGTAKRTVGLLSGILAYAVQSGIIDDNPAHGLLLPADGKRELEDFDGKYAALGRAIRLAEDRREPWQAIDAIRLAALTGMRRGEVIGLRWAEVDLAGRELRLQNSKTGKSVRPLALAAVDVLRSIQNRKAAGEYVFPAERRGEGAFGGLPKSYGRIVGHSDLKDEERAVMDDLTLHGLRHGFAKTANGLGLTLPTIAALLGHSAGGVTADYARHVSIDAVLIASADKVANEVSRLMGEARTAKVVELPTARARA